ncbi:M20 family metallopeptidase [Acidipila sp. 4G-K13]|uniref:M20 family peptidase n=2 Tax=Paracidobacterium acidisoli TaxID=2303751 RepID=A0A372INW4_9BACT|nr:M20 family metallopeptidase [Paracidobacterium acidisoli]MBT9332195.1 M20 family metallopeptidase [Paracidobacterium acidisoli]
MLRRLSELVHIESPSGDKAAVDRAVASVASWCEAASGRVRLHRQREFGNLLEASFRPRRSSSSKPILLLGHLDTVWEIGTLRNMPWREEKGQIGGPGILDMKAGVVMALTALQILQEHNALSRPVILLLHSDEEVGSHVSRPLTEKIACRCEAVYVLEPAQGDQGAYKTARKGIGNYRLDVNGIASHSGVDFSAGHSAVLELARQIERIAALTDPKRGITVNPGVIGGGTRSNVVAAHAWVDIDVRIARAGDAPRIDRALRRLRPVDRNCSLHISGGLNRPPMERTRGTVALFRRAQHFAAALGFSLEEAATGGGSDGNFTAALGIPTLDGMGAVGAGAHAAHEHILAASLIPRTALLAAMLL